MPGHLIISWIYAKSGILFGIFSVLACQGTLSQAGFTRRAASFLGFFSFGMPGHLIISWIYAKSGILFGIFSVLACQGTWSQAGFTRQAASFFDFFHFWHAGVSDHKPDLRGKRHPFLDFFSFGMPGHLIISRIYAKSGILFWIFSFLACRRHPTT